MADLVGAKEDQSQGLNSRGDFPLQGEISK